MPLLPSIRVVTWNVGSEIKGVGSEGWDYHWSEGWDYHWSEGWDYHWSEGWDYHWSEGWDYHWSEGWDHQGSEGWDYHWSEGWDHQGSEGWDYHWSEGWDYHWSEGWDYHWSEGWDYHWSEGWNHQGSEGWDLGSQLRDQGSLAIGIGVINFLRDQGSGCTTFVGSGTKTCHAFESRIRHWGAKVGSAMKKHTSLQPWSMRRTQKTLTSSQEANIFGDLFFFVLVICTVFPHQVTTVRRFILSVFLRSPTAVEMSAGNPCSVSRGRPVVSVKWSLFDWLLRLDTESQVTA